MSLVVSTMGATIASLCYPTLIDLNEIAFAVVQHVIGHTPRVKKSKSTEAVELGRLGGLKGGHARAAKLSTSEKSEIARKAANARWAKKTR